MVARDKFVHQKSLSGGLGGTSPIIILVLAAFLFTVLALPEDAEAAKKKKKYADWKGVAADMALEFDAAQKDIEADQYKDAYAQMRADMAKQIDEIAAQGGENA